MTSVARAATIITSMGQFPRDISIIISQYWYTNDAIYIILSADHWNYQVWRLTLKDLLSSHSTTVASSLSTSISATTRESEATPKGDQWNWRLMCNFMSYAHEASTCVSHEGVLLITGGTNQRFQYSSADHEIYNHHIITIRSIAAGMRVAAINGATSTSSSNSTTKSVVKARRGSGGSIGRGDSATASIGMRTMIPSDNQTSLDDSHGSQYHQQQERQVKVDNYRSTIPAATYSPLVDAVFVPPIPMARNNMISIHMGSRWIVAGGSRSRDTPISEGGTGNGVTTKNNNNNNGADWWDTYQDPSQPNGYVTRRIDVYDWNTECWSRLPDMITPRRSMAMCAFDGQLYCFGWFQPIPNTFNSENFLSFPCLPFSLM
jgi:hypothetical protein